MILIIIALRDDKTEAFGQPQFVKKRGEAIRSLADAVNSNDKQSALAQHPEDFSLYEIGTYDDDSGKIEGRAVPDLITHAKDLIR